MISVTEALTLIDPYRPDLGAESVPLLDASGRQLSDLHIRHQQHLSWMVMPFEVPIWGNQ